MAKSEDTEYLLQAINYLMGGYHSIQRQLREKPNAEFQELDTSEMDKRIKQIRKDIN